MSIGFNKVKVKSTSNSSTNADVKKNETTSNSSTNADVKKNETTSNSSTNADVKKNETTSNSSTKDEVIEGKDGQYIIRALEQTKARANEVTDKARNQIPEITNLVKDYQQQTIQASEDIANDFLESQKEIINSFESIWTPIVENLQNRYLSYCMSPIRVTDSYARTASNIADFTVATSRLINYSIYSNLETFKIVMQNAQENAKEFLRVSTNAAKTMGDVTRDNL